MKSAWVVLLAAAAIFTGCASDGTSQAARTGGEPAVMQEERSEFDEKNADEVFWSHREIRNLQRLDEFIERVNQKVQDQIRVNTVTKEGEPVVMDISFDGNRLHVTSFGNTKTYDTIYVSSRHSDHYQGEFVEYWVGMQEDESQKELILQIKRASSPQGP